MPDADAAKKERVPKRADAELNRTRVLDAARQALDASAEISMHAIARDAGVGPGTLYRHFPNREALIMAVHRTDVAELVDVAPALLREHPPIMALRAWLDRLAAYGRLKHGLVDALHAVMRAQLAQEGYEPVIGAIDLLLTAARKSGDVRPDVDAEEVLLLTSFLWRLDLDEEWDARSTHLLDLVLEGLAVPSRQTPKP